MQSVSQALLNILRSDAQDLIPILEFYHFNAVPTVNGFDPAQAEFLLGYAAVSGITFRNRTFHHKVKSFGEIKRTITKEFNNVSVTLSNLDREVAAFNFSIGFEGLIMVVRLVSRSVSTTLDDSIVLFTGRCEKPDSFDRKAESVSITAKQIIGSTELNMPRRKFSPDDENGRHPSDPLFEGFRFSVQYGTVSYSVRERRGGLLGFLGFKKNVIKTLQYSSHSDLDAEKSLPAVFGRGQMAAHHIAYIDNGTEIKVTSAFCEGEIKNFVNTRSVTPGFVIASLGGLRGKLGGVGDQLPDPNWIAPGYYSRTAYVRAGVAGSQAQQDDPAPEIVSVVLGTIVPLPDTSGVFNIVDWTDNPVYIARFLLASEDYLKLSANFLDDAINFESGKYADGILLDTSGTDAVALPNFTDNLTPGADYKLYLPTGRVTPEYLKLKAGILGTNDIPAVFTKEVKYNTFDETAVVPIEPELPAEGGGTGSGGNLSLPSFVLRRRYTANVVATEQQKIVDFLFNVLFPAARMYPVTTAKGKVGLRVARPADQTQLRTSATVGATSVNVLDVEPWRTSQAGKIIVGANLTSSELRTVSAARYSTASNSIALAASNLSVSGATLTGANNSNSTGTGTITAQNAAGVKTVTIDGFSISYTPEQGDTVESIAGFFWGAINAHPVLKHYIEAVWTGNAVVTVKSKLGTLDLSSALGAAHSAALASPTAAPIGTTASGGQLAVGSYKLSYAFETASGETLPSPQATIAVAANQKVVVSSVSMPANAIAVNWYFSVAGATTMKLRRVQRNTGQGFEITTPPLRTGQVEPNYNSTGEQILRVAYAFDSSNMLAGSFKFPLGGKQKPVNRVILKYRDATQDFKLTELRIKDPEHINRVKRINDLEVSGAAIDNFHQAKRIGNGVLAEHREGDFFTALSSDGEALLLEEGEVVAVTDESGGLVNLPVRVEDVQVRLSSGYPEISIACKRYSRAFYDDEVDEKTLPIPTSLVYGRSGSKGRKVVITTDNAVILPNNSFVIINSASATSHALDSTMAQTGDELVIKNICPHVVSIEPSAGTIDGRAARNLRQWESITVRFDGSDWLII